MQPLTNDDLLWIIGQKEAQLILATKQIELLTAENARLTKALQPTEDSDAAALSA